MEATKGIKPATPLPWEIHAFHQWRYEDAAYIVHAANNYGRLVEALRFIANRADIKDGDDPLRECAHIKGSAASLLRELGESA